MGLPEIFFDNIVFSLQKAGGVSIVWYELLSRYLKGNASSGAFFIDYKASDNMFRSMLDIPEQQIIQHNAFPLPLKRYLPVHIKSDHPFLFHSSYYRICPNKKAVNITTVHDFTHEYFTKGFTKAVHCWQKYHAICHSDHIICISENTKKDLLKFIPEIEENKISVVYNGVSETYYREEMVDESALPFPAYSYVLFVGGRNGYKNFKFVAEAIRDSDLNLVIVGEALADYEKIFLNSQLQTTRYTCVGRTSNQQLNILYNRAFCLFYPSSYEGFGIPIIEAQKAGYPVIAYKASSIPEIAGSDRLLLDKLDREMAAVFFKILKDPDSRRQIIEEGLVNAQRFSWENTYKETLKVYEYCQKEIKTS